ncbi:MAG: hypothetical protein LBP33_05835 [Candidatus Adiutrix sp.]|jgi:predicted transcriptional regulator|nr:hypothetical protein [Candidatus Adiutrix sp.]
MKALTITIDDSVQIKLGQLAKATDKNVTELASDLFKRGVEYNLHLLQAVEEAIESRKAGRVIDQSEVDRHVESFLNDIEDSPDAEK